MTTNTKLRMTFTSETEENYWKEIQKGLLRYLQFSIYLNNLK